VANIVGAAVVVIGIGFLILAKERPEHPLASDAAVECARGPERDHWREGERTVLRGRLEATILASPRA
jgi:hypothetical protein